MTTKETKVQKPLPDVKKQKSEWKKGQFTYLPLFDGKVATIERFDITKVSRYQVVDTPRGKKQLFTYHLTSGTSGESIKVHSSHVFTVSKYICIQNAFRSFRYLSPEERLLSAVFGDGIVVNRDKAFDALVRLATTVLRTENYKTHNEVEIAELKEKGKK